MPHAPYDLAVGAISNGCTVLKHILRRCWLVKTIMMTRYAVLVFLARRVSKFFLDYISTSFHMLT